MKSNFEGDKSPTIGDNVRICAGAKVIGDVIVGDNSTVGAGAVVVKNIPSNTTVGGVPAIPLQHSKTNINKEEI